MFQTTVWDDVKAAGAHDADAMNRIAEQYRAPILAFIRSRGVAGPEAEDFCHDVFVRVLAGGVIGKADATKGTFRTLLCTVTIRVMQDWRRKRRELPWEGLDPAVVPEGFDRLWVLHLVERAFAALKRTSPASYEALRGHLTGRPPERNKLWIARRKLSSLIRNEIALTCRSPEELEAEVARLSPYLRPAEKD
jgi:DNA-directed RNA polymerase specialized sigma24 family protein